MGERAVHAIYNPQIPLKTFQGSFQKGQAYNSVGSLSNAYDWLDRINGAGELGQWDDVLKFNYAKNLLEGQAHSWYNAHKSKIHTWQDFENEFVERFAVDTNSVVTALYSKRQTFQEPVRVYADEFLNLHDRLQLTDGPLPPRVLTTQFISGLLPELRDKVLNQEPRSVEDALKSAIYFEGCNSLYGNYSEPARYPLQPQHDTYPNANHNPNANYNPNYNNNPNTNHNPNTYQGNQNRPNNNRNNGYKGNRPWQDKPDRNFPQHQRPSQAPVHEKENNEPVHKKPEKDPRQDAIDDLSRQLADMKIRQFQQSPEQHFVQKMSATQSAQPALDEAYMANLEKIALKLKPLCEDQGELSLSQNYLQVSPEELSMDATLKALQASIEDMRVLFKQKGAPVQESDMMSRYHEELAPQAHTSQALHTIYEGAVHEDPVIYAEKRKADGSADDDDQVRRRRPRGYADDTFGMRDEPFPMPAGAMPSQPRAHQAPPTDRRAAQDTANPAPDTAPRARAAAYRASPKPQTIVEQLQQLPLKMTVGTYANTCNDKTYKAIMDAFRREPERSPGPPPPPPAPAAAGPSAAMHSTACNIRPSTQHQRNLHASKNKSGCLIVPVKVNGVIFNKGIVDTGASHSMISQGAVRKLGLWDHIYKDRMQGYDTASGDHVKPWGILKNIDVAIGVLELPLEHVLVSGSTGFDILVGNDWLRLAQAEISYEKQQISYRIDPDHIGVFSFADETPTIMVNCMDATKDKKVHYLDWEPPQSSHAGAVHVPGLGPDSFPFLLPGKTYPSAPKDISPASSSSFEYTEHTDCDSDDRSDSKQSGYTSDSSKYSISSTSSIAGASSGQGIDEEEDVIDISQQHLCAKSSSGELWHCDKIGYFVKETAHLVKSSAELPPLDDIDNMRHAANASPSKLKTT